MGLLRRRDEETLNEKMLREAGYSPDGVPLAETDVPSPQTTDFLTTQSQPKRPREIFATVDAPELAANGYTFAALGDGALIVDDSDTDVSDLADAVEDQLAPPYRASATRQSDRVWVVTAWPIDVEQLAVEGTELELSSVGGVQTFIVDGQSIDASRVPSKLVR